MKVEIYSRNDIEDLISVGFPKNTADENVMIKGSIWCRLKTVSNECKYTFFPLNVPSEYRGTQSKERLVGNVVCDSAESAVRCLGAMVSLVNNGYGEERNWLVALDIDDIMTHIFNGSPMKYLHGDIDSIKTGKFEQCLKDAELIFMYFNLPNDEKAVSDCKYASAQFCSRCGTSTWMQISVHASCECYVDIWYR